MAEREVPEFLLDWMRRENERMKSIPIEEAEERVRELLAKGDPNLQSEDCFHKLIGSSPELSEFFAECSEPEWNREWKTRVKKELERFPDPPPLKWSDLRYVFDIKEDRNGKEAIQA
jgi:hypothetical protein